MTKKKEQTYELRYTGHLTGAPTIYLHYGTENWSDVCEVKMRKLKTCYKTEITVPTGSEINFCFRDAQGNWDNNWGNDYYYSPEVGGTYSQIDVTPCDVTSSCSTKSSNSCSSKCGTTKHSK